MIQTITTHYTDKEFITLIEAAVSKALGEIKIESTANTEIIDRGELCKRLNITEPSVIRWEKKGRIPRIEIGSSIRYDWNKVLEALETKKKH